MGAATGKKGFDGGADGARRERKGKKRILGRVDRMEVPWST